MTMTPVDIPAELELFIPSALQLQEQFQSLPEEGGAHTDFLRGSIEEAAVFMGLYYEDGALRGHLIKGSDVLMAIAGKDETKALNLVGMFVSSPEEAEAMRITFGDGAADAAASRH